MKGVPYGDMIAANIRAARSRRGLAQAVVVARMRDLGFTSWHRQTMGNIERGDRRVTAEEIFGLAEALEVAIPMLMTAAEPDVWVEFPNGKAIHSISVERLAGRGLNDHAVQWPDGGTSAVFLAYTRRPAADPFDESLRPMMAAQGWPEGAESHDGT